MSPHYVEFIEEHVKAGDSVVDSTTKAPILRWGWLLAAAVFIISMGFYLWHFHEGFSAKQEVWGQFGDFMGGVVNPLVGLFTIWLLTVSLNQSHLALHQTALALKQSEAALKQSADQIGLAKQALLDNQKIQATTEAALKDQTAIAANARDMNNAISLYRELDRQYVGMAEGIEQDGQLLPNSAEYMVNRNEYLRLIEIQRTMLGAVLSIETHRLIQEYCPKEMRNTYDDEIAELTRAK